MGRASRRKRQEQDKGQEHARPPRESAPYAPPDSGHGPELLQWILLVGLVAVIVYLSGVLGDFVFDDKLIQRDARIHGETSFWTIFVTDYWYEYFGSAADLYRPLTIASYALNHAVAGLSSPAYHVVNITLHALVCVALVLLVDALFRDRAFAIVAGLLFATHPIHTEAVTNIVGRAELMAALFLLAALYLHVRRYRVGSAGPRLWLPIAGALYLGALLSKESAIVGPALLLLVEWLMRLDGRPAAGPAAEVGEGRAAPSAAGVLALYLGVAVFYLMVRYSVLGLFLQEPPLRSEYLLFGHPLSTRFFTALVILGTYVRLFVYPVTLSADYSYRQLPLTDSLDSLAGVAGLVTALALVAGFAVALRKRSRPGLFALGFFAIPYALVANLLIPIGVLVGERLMYLPSVGFCCGVASIGVVVSRRMGDWSRVGWVRHVPAAALVLLVALYGGRTWMRNLDWKDHETLYLATTRAAPNCHSAHFNYSAVLLKSSKRSDAAEVALEHLLRAYEIRDDHYPSLVNMTAVYLRLGEPELAREIALRGLEVRPGSRKLDGLLRTAERQLAR
jgi:hypothetical protein